MMILRTASTLRRIAGWPAFFRYLRTSGTLALRRWAAAQLDTASAYLLLLRSRLLP